MKQNSQWLSQVRIRSKTAEDTSTPSGSPGSLATRTTTGPVPPAAPDHEVQIGLVDQQAVLDDVPGCRAVEGEELVPGPQPARSGR